MPTRQPQRVRPTIAFATFFVPPGFLGILDTRELLTVQTTREKAMPSQELQNLNGVLIEGLYIICIIYKSYFVYLMYNKSMRPDRTIDFWRLLIP